MPSRDPKKRNAYYKKYREQNKERIKAQKADYYRRKREEILEVHKKYREEYPERMQASRDKYLESNRDYARERSRERYHENKDKYRERNRELYWNDPEKYRQKAQYYQSRKRAAQHEQALFTLGIKEDDNEQRGAKEKGPGIEKTPEAETRGQGT